MPTPLATNLANLSGIGMGSDDAVVLADELPTKCALVKFDISNNTLCVAGGKALAEGLKGNQVLTELNLANNSLGLVKKYGDADMAGVIAIGDAIPTMGAMASLNVSANDLWAKGAKHIAAALPGCK